MNTRLLRMPSLACRFRVARTALLASHSFCVPISRLRARLGSLRTLSSSDSRRGWRQCLDSRISPFSIPTGTPPPLAPRSVSFRLGSVALANLAVSCSLKYSSLYSLSIVSRAYPPCHSSTSDLQSPWPASTRRCMRTIDWDRTR